jgi:hypothetical protein
MKRSAKGPVIMSKQDTKIVKKYMNSKIWWGNYVKS